MKTSPVKILVVTALFSAVFAFSTSALAFASSTKTVGSACTKLGTGTKSGTSELKCVKSGTKLIWKKVKVVKASAAVKPSSSPSATPSAEATLPTEQSSYAINIVASQWSFSFSYLLDGKAPLAGGAANSSVLYLPEAKPVRFTLTSRDVNHGFWIPGLSIDMSVDPSATGHLDFTANKIGTYPGQCNVSSCGRGHAGMKFTVNVVSQTDYLKHLSTLKTS